MSSRDAANTASDSPADFNRRLNVPFWVGGTFTFGRNDHCHPPHKDWVYRQYSTVRAIDQSRRTLAGTLNRIRPEALPRGRPGLQQFLYQLGYEKAGFSVTVFIEGVFHG